MPVAAAKLRPANALPAGRDPILTPPWVSARLTERLISLAQLEVGMS
jgi:hypothetical protein